MNETGIVIILLCLLSTALIVVLNRRAVRKTMDKIEKMFAHNFDYQAIAKDAIERYSSEAYYHKLMDFYK